jgi:hypothetical protein
MKQALLAALLMTGAPASAQDQDGEGQTIVVTGTPLRDSERALKACLARKCPPKEDIDASLAHAENLFVAGDYKKARRTTLAAISRNGRYSKTLPVDVSDLYRANARISIHLGEANDFRSSTYATRRALKSGLPGEDPRILAAGFEVAGMHASMGDLDRSREVFDDLIRDANKLGRPDLAATARVRRAWLDQLEGYTQIAREALERVVAQDGDPRTRVARMTAQILLARLDRLRGRTDSSDALVEQLAGEATVQPILIYSPRVRLRLGSGSAFQLGNMATDTFEDKWIDVGFWVGADGRVKDLEILRKSGSADWTPPVLRSIRGRIYAPLKEDSFRVERYSYTSLWEFRTGSRLRQRSADARVEYLDLTAAPPPAKASAPNR